MDPALFQENERAAPAEAHRLVTNVGEIVTESTNRKLQVDVAYETWGTLTPAKDNAVLICHALSGDSHAIGWWDRMVGPGKAIDTDHLFVIGTNCLGGCQGTTGPASIGPDGQRYGSRFPMVEVGDMVEAQTRLVASLGIERLHGVAGGSMGGMCALEWTLRGKVRKAFVTASCRAHSAMQIGINEAARQAVVRDAKWRGGDYPPDDPPSNGLAVARMIGHISFLSEDSFDRKFGRQTKSPGFNYSFQPEFEVESYLKHQGEKFTKRFDANSLLVLTRAIDYYDCTSLERSSSEYAFCAFTSDWLYPMHQAREMHEMALAAGRPSRLEIVDLPYGHDAFLLDGEQQGAVARKLFLG